MLDAKVASALKRIITNQHFRRRLHVEEQHAEKHYRFLRGRQMAQMFYEHFRATGADEAALNISDLSIVSLQGDDTQDSDTSCDQSLLSASEIPMENVLESSCKMRIREQEIERHRAMPSYQRLTTVRRYIDQR